MIRIKRRPRKLNTPSIDIQKENKITSAVLHSNSLNMSSNLETTATAIPAINTSTFYTLSHPPITNSKQEELEPYYLDNFILAMNMPVLLSINI